MTDKNYKINLVKKLREKTGLTLMDCKRILESTNFDYEKAWELVPQYSPTKVYRDYWVINKSEELKGE